MRRIDEVKNKKMKGVKMIKVLNEKSIQIYFNNGEDIILEAASTDYGYSAEMRIAKDNINSEESYWRY